MALSVGCERKDLFKGIDSVNLADAKAITSFSFESIGITGNIDEGTHDIFMTVPYGTDVTTLVATFTSTGEAVHVGAVEQVSGTTPNDFSSPLVYTVTAEDGSTRDYTVTLTIDAGTPYEIQHIGGSNSAWYGGDANHVTGRNVGQGQSVYVDQDIVLESFAFYFNSNFTKNTDASTADVTLRLNIRDDTGAMLDIFDVIVPTSFTGGWVFWSGINMGIAAYTTVIFSSFVIGGFDINEYDSSIAGNLLTDTYTDGQRYSINGPYSDVEMENWTNWSISNYDLHFWLQGVVP